MTARRREASPPPSQPPPPSKHDNKVEEEEEETTNTTNEHELKTANHVYILDNGNSWIPAQVVERPSSTQAIVSIPQYINQQVIVCDGGRTAKRFIKDTVDLSKYSNQALPLQNVDPEGRLQVVEDMVDLPFLHEAAILYNLKARHIESLPYTRTGDIVLAVNPYQWYPNLYTPQQRQYYAQSLVWNPIKMKDDPRTLIKPHVYEASCLAYKGLLTQGNDQSILVSGESGAGKTETVKIMLSDLANVQKGPQANTHTHANTMETDNNDIVQRVLETNPLLEAFGNAQTLRNDNSSRFGKYLSLQFDRTTSRSKCTLAGSKCEVYLLEKSRVTLHHPDERTYHVFYQLLAAPEETKIDIWEEGLSNTDQESFDYVGWSAIDSIEGKTDAARFQLTVQALELIGVKGETLRTLWRAICIVLQLGNLEFDVHPDKDDASLITSTEDLLALSTLMGIPLEDLTKSLTIRNVEAGGEIFPVPLTPEKAKESTDAFAKEIYAKTFLWLVRTINDATCAERNYSIPLDEFGMIGLLDIFGFETFQVNRFEQLCINYANEKLQQKFTQDVFRSVQLEYEMEGIQLEEITYDDNTDVLDLVEGRMGLLAFLNEECVRPKGSDKTFVYKAQSMNKDNPCFFRDLHAPDNEFGICHYAGKVTYDATNMVVKNMDTLPTDLQDCAKRSTNAIVANELNNEEMMNPLHTASLAESATAAPKRRRRKASMAGTAAKQKLFKRRASNILAETVWTKFKNQLSRLMDTLSLTQTRYIRCIKPNTQKLPHQMEHVSTVEQLRCAGVVAAVTISRSAFPNRLEHLGVLERFKSLYPKGDHIKVLNDFTLDPGERIYKAVSILLTIALKDMEFTKQNLKFRAFVMGKTRAYFRAGALEFLEGERLKYLGNFATVVQTQVRGYAMRTKFARHKHSVIVLQSHHRQRVERNVYQTKRRATIQIQCWYRIIFAALAIFHLRRMFKSRMIQTRWRIRRDQRRFRQLKAAAIVVQTMVRGGLQRPKYRQALIDKKEDAKLENQLRTLQRKLEEAEAKRVEAEKQAEARATTAIQQYKKEEEKKAKEEEEKQKQEDMVAAPADNLDVEIQETATGKRKDAEEEEHVEANHEEPPQQTQEQLTAEQQKLMDESGKMLEYLRKEVFKLRGYNQQLKTDFDLLKDNNQRLMDANASAGASFAALNQHAKQLSKQNTQILGDFGKCKTQVQKLTILQVELKEELKLKQATYVAEVQSRLQYQKALQKVTDMIQENCRDNRLVEKVLTVADECEMEYMTSEEPAFEPQASSQDGTSMNDSRSSIFGYLNFFSS